jgi:hypothetical protein
MLAPRLRFRLHPSKALILEAAAFLCVVVGVGMIYIPAALIITGIGLFLAAIGEPPHDNSAERNS